MSSSIICQACGVEAPTRYVDFHQNIGALVMRFRRQVKGNLCKRCIHANFWKMTGITASVGWLGTISLVLAPAMVINNVARYLSCITLSKVPPDARRPVLTDDAIAKIGPVAQELIGRLNNNDSLDQVAVDLASRIGVTPGQIVHYVMALSQEHQRQQHLAKQNAQIRGFPVQPPPLPAQPVPVLSMEPSV